MHRADRPKPPNPVDELKELWDRWNRVIERYWEDVESWCIHSSNEVLHVFTNAFKVKVGERGEYNRCGWRSTCFIWIGPVGRVFNAKYFKPWQCGQTSNHHFSWNYPAINVPQSSSEMWWVEDKSSLGNVGKAMPSKANLHSNGTFPPKNASERTETRTGIET